MIHYYYHRWHFSGDDLLQNGMYHSTVITTEDWKTFVSHCLPTKEFLLIKFDSEEKMREYAKGVGL